MDWIYSHGTPGIRMILPGDEDGASSLDPHNLREIIIFTDLSLAVTRKRLILLFQ